jgi:adenylylsulfate kinase
MKKVIWFTGLSGAGKTTLATGLVDFCRDKNLSSILIDGDDVRSGLSSDLDFSENSRYENIRRIAEISKLLLKQLDCVIVSTISPAEELRDAAKKIIGDDQFVLIYVSTPIKICIKRDSKGLYKKSNAGLIKDLTGIGSKFEVPENYDFIIDTSETNKKDALVLLKNFVRVKQKK